MQKYLLSALAMAVSLVTCAEEKQIEQQKIDQRLNDSRTEKELKNVQPQVVSTSHSRQISTGSNSIRMTTSELEKHPDLVLRAIYPALLQGNSETLNILFPIYQKLPVQYQNPILTKWSKAILAKAANDYSGSIRLYRDILAEQADNEPVRLQLATVLFANNELEAAEDQFKKLRAEPLPAEISALIDEYLNAIVKRDRWTFSGGLTYFNDPNINNAPKSGTIYNGWIAPERESAEGIGFNLNIGKKWSWGNGFYNELRLNGNGKYYWDNRKYNEMSGRGSVGFGFQNGKTDVEILPFMEQSLYAGGSKQSDTLKRFSKSGGLTFEIQHWLSPKWQLNGSYEYAEQRYVTRKHLNGNYHFVSLGGLYLANAKRYFFANVNYNRTATRDRDDSYFRRGVILGWQQEWDWGLSSRISLSLSQKRYKAPMPVFNITQRNRELGLQASLWHRAVHYWGITPRLTYSFTKTSSNHTFYSYDKHRVFVDFSKSF